MVPEFVFGDIASPELNAFTVQNQCSQNRMLGLFEGDVTKGVARCPTALHQYAMSGGQGCQHLLSEKDKRPAPVFYAQNVVERTQFFSPGRRVLRVRPALAAGIFRVPVKRNRDVPAKAQNNKYDPCQHKTGYDRRDPPGAADLPRTDFRLAGLRRGLLLCVQFRRRCGRVKIRDIGINPAQTDRPQIFGTCFADFDGLLNRLLGAGLEYRGREAENACNQK